jgi:hypothetical protein
MDIICDCITVENSYQVIKQCDMCINRNIRLRDKNKNRRDIERSIFINYMNGFDNSKNMSERIEILQKLLEHCLESRNFLAYQSDIRNLIINKIKEFRNDEQLSSLFELFNKLDIFFINLESHIAYQK